MRWQIICKEYSLIWTLQLLIRWRISVLLTRRANCCYAIANAVHCLTLLHSSVMLIYMLCFTLQGLRLRVSVCSGQTACHRRADPDLQIWISSRRPDMWKQFWDSCFSGADRLQGNSAQLGYLSSQQPSAGLPWPSLCWLDPVCIPSDRQQLSLLRLNMCTDNRIWQELASSMDIFSNPTTPVIPQHLCSLGSTAAARRRLLWVQCTIELSEFRSRPCVDTQKCICRRLAVLCSAFTWGIPDSRDLSLRCWLLPHNTL